MPANKWVEDILSKMTSKEKCNLLFGKGAWNTYGVDRLHVEGIEMHDGPLGIRKPSEGKALADLTNSEPATCFPGPCLNACSWDKDAMRELGNYFAYEANKHKTDMVLAPGINIKRNPLCGRNFEYLSEDPLLAGELATSFINGVQEFGIGTSLKHFALNDQESYRLNYSAVVDVRALREIYLKGFEIAVKKAQPWTVMCSYNRINEVYSCDNDWLLKDTLKKEWGFKGAVVTDWGAITYPVTSHNHGTDLEMPCLSDRTETLVKAYDKGKLNKEAVDDSVRRILSLYEKKMNRKPFKSDWDESKSHAFASKIAEESVVLAKNDNFLPLHTLSKVAIIGSLADKIRYQGAGSSQIVPINLVNFLSLGKKDQADLIYAPGYDFTDKGKNLANIKEAVEVAKKSDKVLMFLGLPESYESEGFDRTSLSLPPEEIQLFEEVYKVNQNIGVVLSLGAPVELPFIKSAKAVVISYLLGEAGNEALYKLVMGKANFAGRLAETWPLSYKDVPSSSYYPGTRDYSLYKESVFIGYRYYATAKKEVMFPFGHGLSYTKFSYADLKVPEKFEGKDISVSLKVSNIGDYDGFETVQLYVGATNSLVYKPLRELRDFKKVFIKKGETKEVELPLNSEAFSHFDEKEKSFVLDGGAYKIEVGSSSENILLSSSIEVSSSYRGEDDSLLYPSFRHLSEQKEFSIPDEEFARLIHRDIPIQKDTSKRPYTLNSTLYDVRKTFIGKILKKVIKNMFKTEDENNPMFIMAMQITMRSISMVGVKDKQLLAILDLANGRPLKAIWDLMFGKRKD